MEPNKQSLYEIENVKTRKPIGNVRPPGGFLSSYVPLKIAPGSLGIIGSDVSSGNCGWHRRILQSLSCYCVGTNESGFHAAETERPEMTPESEMIQNHQDTPGPRDGDNSPSWHCCPVAETRRPRLQVDSRSGRFTKVSGQKRLEKSVTS